MSKLVKEMVVSELQKRLGSARDMLVIDSSRLDAHSNNKMRLKLQAQGIYILNVKNTLAVKALGDLGVTALKPYLVGPSALVWGGPDMVALSREMSKWVKDLKKIEIKGGTLDGTSLDPKQVDVLSKSPGREELIGAVLTLIRSPGGRLAGALLGPGGLLAGQVKSIAEKTEDAADPVSAP